MTFLNEISHTNILHQKKVMKVSNIFSVMKLELLLYFLIFQLLFIFI